MPTYTITNISPIIDQNTGKPKQDNYGNTKYKLYVKDADGQVYNFSKGYKGNPDKVGDTLTGTLDEMTGNYGTYLKFTPERTFNGNSGGGRSERDPEVQSMIVRQNALTNAVAFLTAQVVNKAKTKDDLTTDNVLLIATKFAAFSKGEIEAKPAPAPVDQAEENPFEDLNGYE